MGEAVRSDLLTPFGLDTIAVNVPERTIGVRVDLFTESLDEQVHGDLKIGVLQVVGGGGDYSLDDDVTWQVASAKRAMSLLVRRLDESSVLLVARWGSHDDDTCSATYYSPWIRFLAEPEIAPDATFDVRFEEQP